MSVATGATAIVVAAVVSGGGIAAVIASRVRTQFYDKAKFYSILPLTNYTMSPIEDLFL